MRWLRALFAFLVFASSAHAAPVQIEGFEMGGIEGCRSVTGSPTVSAVTFRSGAYSFRALPVTTGTSNCRMGIPGTTGLPTAEINQATLYTRVYINIGALPASADEEILVFLDTGGTQKSSVRIDSAGKLAVYDNLQVSQGTGATTLSTGTWYRLELQTTTDTLVSAFELKIDGSVEDSGTMLQGSTNHGSVRLGKGTNRNGQGYTIYFDDFSIDPAAYPGAGAILKMSPDSNGSTAQWTSGTGASDYTQVDEIPTDDDTTYIQKSSAASQAHLVGLESTSTAGISGTISAAKAWQRCREVTSVTSATLIRIRSGSTNSDSSTLNGSTTYANQFRILATDPNTSSAWTTSGLDSAEIGVSDTASTDQVRCTTMLMQVDFLVSPTRILPISMIRKLVANIR